MSEFFEAFLESLVAWRWWRRIVFALMLAGIIYVAGLAWNGLLVWLVALLFFEFLGWISARKTRR